jgi:protein involved in polysaccharide export with SLBB domain
MGYTIVRLLQRFDRLESFMPEVINGDGQPTLMAEIVLQPGDGVKVGFWDAADLSEKEKLVDV